MASPRSNSVKILATSTSESSEARAAAAEREEEEFCFGFDGLQFLCQSRGGQLEVFSVNVANADADTASTGP